MYCRNRHLKVIDDRPGGGGGIKITLEGVFWLQADNHVLLAEGLYRLLSCEGGYKVFFYLLMLFKGQAIKSFMC